MKANQSQPGKPGGDVRGDTMREGSHQQEQQQQEQRSGGKQPAQQGSEEQPSQQVSGEHGEGNYKASRDYAAGLQEHMKHHDIEKEARKAAPKNDQERREMQAAEEEGRKRAQGMEEGKGSGKAS